MGFIQDFLAPASYWRNPQDSDLFNWYLSDSRYLPYINNEKHHLNSEMFKKRFSSLDDVLLLKFEDDKTIYPSCSSHF
jgi:palmitoyl-protein thioesterase